MKTLAELTDQQMGILVRDVEQLLRALVRESISLGQQLTEIATLSPGQMPLWLQSIIDEMVEGKAEQLLTVVEFNILGSVSRLSDPKE